MHIPDGFLSHSLNAATFVISVGACAYGVKRVNRKFGEREVPLMGVTAAIIFAAQMIGTYYSITDKIIWDAGLEIGMNKAAPDFRLTTGLTWLFKP